MADDTTAAKNKLQLSLDFRLICVVLVLVIAGMLAMWRPWSAATTSDRTVKVNGEATVKATADEYVFYPTYEFKNSDKQAALTALTKKSDEIVAKLKTLGIKDEKIKTNATNYDTKLFYSPPNDDGTQTYSLQLTVTAINKDEAQKVQDYLVTTTPSGTITPQPQFSQGLRKQLESKARDEASKDARTKADQMAKNTGFKLGAVKAIEEQNGFGGITPMMATDVAMSSAGGSPEKLSVQPGENELSYSISVTYFIK